MPVATNKEVPNLEDKENLTYDMHRIFIEHTKGIWLRHHIKNQEIEIWFNGKMVASWSDRHLIEHNVPDSKNPETFINAHTVTAMLSGMIDVGKRLRSKEIRDLING